MFCKYCGKQIDNDSEFCQHCGKLQQKNIIKNDDVIPEESDTVDLYGGTTKSSKKTDTDTSNDENIIVNHTKVKKHRSILILVFALIAIVGVVVSFGLLNGFDHKLSASRIAKLSDSVLILYVYDKNHDLLSTGSGFVVNDDKTIITNYHVINQGYYVEAVSENDVHYNIKGATFFDENTDIAVLQFENNTGIKPLVIEESSSVQVGDTVYTIGSPLGLKNTVSNGIVSAIREKDGYSDIQITAPISSGSSGGALLNEYGNVIGITYASYSDGQSLNLAIPSLEFIDKLNGSEVQEFSDISLYASPLGNTIENYSTWNTQLVQYGDDVYESYNSKHEISVYNTKTGISKKLGIYGTNLSVYRGVLYYVSNEGEYIGTYDIKTGEVCNNILLNYPSSARVDTISKIFVSDYGITVVYDVGFFEHSLIQLSFDGTIIGNIDNLPSEVIVADMDTLVCHDYKNWQLVFISLSDLSQHDVYLDFEPGDLCATTDGYLFISDTTENEYGHTVKYELSTGDYTLVNRLDANTYSCFAYNGKIYYPSTDGTKRMSVLGSNWRVISSKYSLNHICFSDDGNIIYAIGTLSSEPQFSTEYTEYYIRMFSDGTQI